MDGACRLTGPLNRVDNERATNDLKRIGYVLGWQLSNCGFQLKLMTT